MFCACDHNQIDFNAQASTGRVEMRNWTHSEVSPSICIQALKSQSEQCL